MAALWSCSLGVESLVSVLRLRSCPGPSLPGVSGVCCHLLVLPRLPTCTGAAWGWLSHGYRSVLGASSARTPSPGERIGGVWEMLAQMPLRPWLKTLLGT